MRKQLTDLRRKMAERGIDAYIVPTTDFHGSEYVNDHFKCREYIRILPDRREHCGDQRTPVCGPMADIFCRLRRSFPAAASYEDEPGCNADNTWISQGNIPSDGTVGFDGRIVGWSMG